MDATSENFANSHFRKWSSSLDKSVAITMTLGGNVVCIYYVCNYSGVWTSIWTIREWVWAYVCLVLIHSSTQNRLLIVQNIRRSAPTKTVQIHRCFDGMFFRFFLLLLHHCYPPAIYWLLLCKCVALATQRNIQIRCVCVCVRYCTAARLRSISCMLSHIQLCICFYRTMLNVNHVHPGYCMLAIFICGKSGIEWSKFGLYV